MRRTTTVAGVIGLGLAIAWVQTSLDREIPLEVTVGDSPSIAEREHRKPAAIARTSPGDDTSRCGFRIGQRFAYDITIDSELTFDEAALTPFAAASAGGRKTSQTQKATAAGHLDARVISVMPGGDAILVTRLATWKSDADGEDAFASIAADTRKPYLLRLDPRCHAVAAARLKRTSAIGYRRVLALFDRMDFTLPTVANDRTQTYPSRHLDDFGWYTVENRFVPAREGGEIHRRRLAYEKIQATSDTLPLELRIHTAGGTVRLAPAWFEEITDREDIEAVSNGKVPFRSRSSSRFVATAPDPQAFDGVQIVLADFLWGRPTESELDREHEDLRGSGLAGLPTEDAMARFLAIRDGGQPGAWHDAQRLLRDWMRANPDGVRELAQQMAGGAFSREDQADLVLAMARSGSATAREELEELALGTGIDRDLRVQAASACGDLREPTTDTVAKLQQLGGGPREDTPDDILASAATMSIGTIVDNVGGSEAAAAGRRVLQGMLASGDNKRAVDALYAASNSGDATFLAHAVAYSGSEDEDERAAAAHAMRKMLPSATTTEVLNQLLRDEVHPDVVKQVAESRREQIQTYGGELSAQELALYETKLASAPEGARWEILRTVGEASKLQPEARTILSEWYRSESSHSLRTLIGQYLPAAALTR